MIHTRRTVTIGDVESTIDKDIVLYRGDREVEVEFVIVGSKFEFTNAGNVIKSTNASHGQLVIDTPQGVKLFSEVTPCKEGSVIFVITAEMIDELEEVGLYSFQIRLFDEEQFSRISIPPVNDGIEIRSPLAAEDENNLSDTAVVDKAVVQNRNEEVGPTFNDAGDYNKTQWVKGDVISSGRLNKLEDAIYTIDNNMDEITGYVDTFRESIDTADQTLQADINRVSDRVEEVNRNLSADVADVNRNWNEVRAEMDEFGDTIYDYIDKRVSCITVEEFGVIGDGMVDDYANLQNAMNYACDNGLTLISKSNKIFRTTKTLTITKPFHINFYNSILKCEDKVGLEINLLDASAQSYISNITIDCEYNEAGIDITARRSYLEKIYFTNIIKNGLVVNGGYEVDISKCNFRGVSATSKGIVLNTTDINVRSCYGIDLNVFVENNSDGNRIKDCHAWIWQSHILPNSIFADLKTSAIVQNCVFDTYAIGVRCSAQGTSRVMNNNYIVHPDAYNSRIYDVPPTFIYFTGSPPVYKSVITNNWVSFPSNELTGYDTPGNFSNLKPIQLCCEVSGNTGYYIDMVNEATSMLTPINGNISTRRSYVIRKGNRVSLKAYVAFSDGLPETDTVVFKIPDLMRPFSNFGAFGAMGTNIDNLSRIMYVYITSSGDVIIKNASGDSTMSQGAIICEYDVWQPGIDVFLNN